MVNKVFFKIASRGYALLVILSLMGCGQEKVTITQIEQDIPDISEVPEDNPNEDTDTSSNVDEIPGTIREISSFELVAEMGAGWNLGNSFDVTSRDKTLWGNPLPSETIIEEINLLGFRTLRVPVTWDYHLEDTAPFTLESDYLDRVQRVVNYGLERNMHVILNTHHEEEWAGPVPANVEEISARLSSLWTQIALRFRNYGDSLIFEPLNEPRVIGSPNEWTGGTAPEREALNELHRVSVEAIRATGGNNEKRHLLISTYGASTVPAAMNDLIIPNNDPYIIISQHTYFPWPFAGMAQIPWGSDTDRAQLRAELERVRQKWIVEEQRPVILGEWGAITRNSLEDRLEYAAFYASEAVSRGMLPIVWDDGGNFILFNRHSLSWENLSVAETILEAANP